MWARNPRLLIGFASQTAYFAAKVLKVAMKGLPWNKPSTVHRTVTLNLYAISMK